MKNIIIVLYILFFSFILTAQSDPYADYRYSMQLTGELPLTSLQFHTYSGDQAKMDLPIGEWKDRQYSVGLSSFLGGGLSLLPIENLVTFNSLKPFGHNDGSLWQGRGFNERISLGIEYIHPWFSARLAPEFWIAQNSDYDILPAADGGYGDYWTTFDNLQRYGEDSYYQFNWGDSAFHFHWKDYLTLGFSTENIILGPGRKNNFILSEQASGFPHFEFGSGAPIEIRELGKVEAKIVWGWLEESDFFDDDPDNDYGWISGMSFAYTPSFIPGLSVGFNHFYDKPLSEWDSLDLFRGIPLIDNSNSGTDNKDMLVSVTFDYYLTDVGVNVWFEWGRNDNFSSLRSFWTEPEHTDANTFGISKVLEYQKLPGFFLLSAEVSNLRQNRTSLARAGGPWYRHGWSGYTQGYTNNGQLLGASIGPGSDSQWVSLLWFWKGGSIGPYIQRIAIDKDYFYSLVLADPDALYNTDEGYSPYTELIYGLEWLFFLDNFDIYGQFSVGYNFQYQYQHDVDKYNLHGELGIRWNMY